MEQDFIMVKEPVKALPFEIIEVKDNDNVHNQKPYFATFGNNDHLIDND